MKKKQYQYKTLFLMVLAAFPSASWAENTEAGEATELETIRVEGRRAPNALGRTRQNREQLDREMVQDIRDLVRYDPGITVVEGGRAGSNGFAIRGVDKDRVAITVDGLEQGESRSSSAFQDLFGAYGNYNANRNAAEMEHMSEVVISKGADSITAGSGALGGAVIYRTKSPRDYVDEEKPYHLGLKTGWFSRSNQWIGSITAAGRLGNFDGLAVLTARQGHETKIHSAGASSSMTIGRGTPGNPSNNNYVGTVKPTPDPQDTQSVSNLFRLGYHFNPDNYLSLIYEETRDERETKELSNLFQAFTGVDYRHRNDISFRRRLGWEYENLSTSGPWDKLTVSLDRQHVAMTTFTWDVPESSRLNRIDAQQFFRRRVLTYDLDQLRAAATKHLDYGQTSWDMAYGLGISQKDSSNQNLEYFNYVYYPHIATTRIDANESLVGSRTRTNFVYWNNTLRFNEQFKLNLGVRYDHIRMKTLDSLSLNPHVHNTLQANGLWNRRSTFSAPTYAAALDWNITPNITLQAKYGTGFRAPTTDETWFYFPSSLFWVDPNPDLKAERSRNMEIGISAQGAWGQLALSGFRTYYKDFIDFGSQGVQMRVPVGATAAAPVEVYQNFNRSRAAVGGIELQSRFNLDRIGLPVPQGSYATLAASYMVGNTEGKPINALQPFNAVLGLGYQQPEDRWGLSTQISYFARKNPIHTIADPGSAHVNFPFAHHHQAYWLVDLTGHYRIGKHFTVRGGIYNLFNRQYYTWDSIRSIREFGTVNRINNTTHAGITRFQAPGRNFALTLEAKF